MTFLEFHRALKDFVVFSLTDIRIIDPGFYRTRLNEWQNKGYIRKVLRGYYIFTDEKLDEFSLFIISNKIYKPSYISLQSALSYYNLIPESVYAVTSMSTLLTRSFKTPLANFKYHMIKSEMFFGYDLISSNNTHFQIACPEKAVLDYLYINPTIKDKYDFSKLRINTNEFQKQVNLQKLDVLAEKIGQKSLLRRILAFKEYIQNARS
ncbi:MAG: hypothetical protein ABII27_07510 [bacterium]